MITIRVGKWDILFNVLNDLMFGFEYDGEYDTLLIDFVVFRVMFFFNPALVINEEEEE